MQHLKPFLTLTLMWALGSGVVSCGKDPKQQDYQVKSQLKANVSEKQSQILPMLGNYHGTLTMLDSLDVPDTVLFRLTANSITVQNPGRNDVTQMPIITGDVTTVPDSADTNKDIVIIASFNMSTFDPQSGRITLNMQGAATPSFEGTLVNGRLKGSLKTTKKEGLIDVKKVVQQ